MLAENFKTAAELGLPEVEHQALVTVLRMLERREIKADEFDMSSVYHSCKSPGCLCGWAHFVSNGLAFPEVKTSSRAPLVDTSKALGKRQIGCEVAAADYDSLFNRLPAPLIKLFMLNRNASLIESLHITPSQAAIALRTYLTIGAERWSEALAA